MTFTFSVFPPGVIPPGTVNVTDATTGTPFGNPPPSTTNSNGVHDQYPPIGRAAIEPVVAGKVRWVELLLADQVRAADPVLQT
ncbi:MAG: hypothetical protein ACRELE_07395, partial [Gemmatimonadales bacterium]